MNKRHLHHIWTKIRFIRPWIIFVIALISALICAFALKANNQHMVDLRNAVYSADQKNGDVQKSLANLQQYVTSHMNTKMDSGPSPVYPPIQLKFTYERLIQSRADQIAKNNTQTYTEAQKYCEQQNATDFSGRNRVPCIEAYVQKQGIKLAPISDALYKFDFVSPSWSPDFAGWSMVTTILGLLLFVVLFAIKRISRS
jgi:hypothetical protein